MIILDTHIWIWNVQGDPRLSITHAELIRANESGRIGVSAFSLWEVAKAVELKRLVLPVSVDDWLNIALASPGIEIIPLSAEIAVESTRLPGDFHKDPFDQIIVATARVFNIPLLTADGAILKYPHVKLA